MQPLITFTGDHAGCGAREPITVSRKATFKRRLPSLSRPPPEVPGLCEEEKINYYFNNGAQPAENPLREGLDEVMAGRGRIENPGHTASPLPSRSLGEDTGRWVPPGDRRVATALFPPGPGKGCVAKEAGCREPRPPRLPLLLQGPVSRGSQQTPRLLAGHGWMWGPRTQNGRPPGSSSSRAQSDLGGSNCNPPLLLLLGFWKESPSPGLLSAGGLLVVFVLKRKVLQQDDNSGCSIIASSPHSGNGQISRDIGPLSKGSDAVLRTDGHSLS